MISISEGTTQVVHSELAATSPHIITYMKIPVKRLNRTAI